MLILAKLKTKQQIILMKYFNKIHILLPYKENFFHKSSGAVSLYVSELLSKSIYKKDISVHGLAKKNTKSLNKNFIPIKTSFNPIFSKTKTYLNSYLNSIKNNNPELIEVHNRPSYINFLLSKTSSKIIIFFHNDPLSMQGSETVDERISIIENCSFVLFNSEYIKNCFFNGIDSIKYLDKFNIIYNSTNPLKKFPNKKKIITFVGKLNHAKGYDIYTNAIKFILKKFPDYKSIAIGDEKRKKIFFNHQNFKELGFVRNVKVIEILKKTDIAVIPSRWQEPFGRTALEATRCGCYTICSNKGGLTETSDHAIFIDNINAKKLINSISYAIKNYKEKRKKQILSFKYIKHKIKNNSAKLDSIRKILLKKPEFNKRILNIYNIGIKLNHRLFNISIGKKFSNGFIKNGFDVIEISDRDYYKNHKFDDYLIETIKNFQPSILLFGHSKVINTLLLSKIKINFPHIVICEWNEDYLGPYGPDSVKNFKNLKSRENFVDLFFVTTNPKYLLDKLKNCFYLPIPVDKNIEKEQQFRKKNHYDLFFGLSHGVNRGALKSNKTDERESFLNKIINENKFNCNFFGINKIEPIWSNKFYEEIKKCNMGLNLSRGKPVSLYSSNRLASYMGNGLLVFIDIKTGFKKFFSSNEVVYYKNYNDLIKKISFYKKNDNLRKLVAKNGYKKYFKLFNSKKVTHNMLRIIKKFYK